MKFSELTCCPFCGAEQFYTKNYMYGTNAYRQRFDGEEACNNEDMYEGLIVREGARAYCEDCGRYIGNLTIDKVGKKAKDAFCSYGQIKGDDER